MFFTDDAEMVSTSAKGLAKMMAVIVTVFAAACGTVSERKTETMLLPTPGQASMAPPLVIGAAGPR